MAANPKITPAHREISPKYFFINVSLVRPYKFKALSIRIIRIKLVLDVLPFTANVRAIFLEFHVVSDGLLGFSRPRLGPHLPLGRHLFYENRFNFFSSRVETVLCSIRLRR